MNWFVIKIRSSDVMLSFHAGSDNPHQLHSDPYRAGGPVASRGYKYPLFHLYKSESKWLNPSKVVKADRPDLEEQKAALTRQQNEYKILLKAGSFNHGQIELWRIFFGGKQVWLFFRAWRTICCSDSVLLAMTFSGDMFTINIAVDGIKHKTTFHL